jgi:hypothetical protein
MLVFGLKHHEGFFFFQGSPGKLFLLTGQWYFFEMGMYFGFCIKHCQELIQKSTSEKSKAYYNYTST